MNLYDEINLAYVNGLADLVIACRANDVKITGVRSYLNGFIVYFEVEGGDAILHDGSYGRTAGQWETIGFPWDGMDVSVHSAENLAQLLAAVKIGADWRDVEAMWADIDDED